MYSLYTGLFEAVGLLLALVGVLYCMVGSSEVYDGSSTGGHSIYPLFLHMVGMDDGYILTVARLVIAMIGGLLVVVSGW